MAALINVVSLSATTPGIGVLGVTAGLGAEAQAATGPEVVGGGGRDTQETWWFKAPFDDNEEERQLAWELGVEIRPKYHHVVKFDVFEANALAILEEEAKKDAFMQTSLALIRRDEEARKARLVKIAKVTITVGGIAYVVWRLLPFL